MDPVLSAASDISLTLDESGVIREVTLGASDQPFEESKNWVGMGWSETVTVESQPKVRAMLAEVAADGVSRRRQINHISKHGADVPVAYTAVRVNRGSPMVIAVGRDLRAVSALQQRLIEAQQSLERDYWRMRSIETRYRMLFQSSSEAVLVVDATSFKIVDANPAASKVLGSTEKKLVGRVFPFDLDRDSARAVTEHLATVRAQGRADEVTMRLQTNGATYSLSATLVRHDAMAFFLVRILPPEGDGVSRAVPDPWTGAAKLIEASPDGFVVTDFEQRVVSANRAFLDMVQLSTEEQARGQRLSRWIGRPGAECDRLFTTVREHGVVRLYNTALRGDFGATLEVEVSGVGSVAGEEAQAGLVIRDVGRRLATGARGARDLTQAVEQLTGLVGKMSLKKLVRDTTDLVERHFIRAALEMTDDNRTSAAEVLGLSRQSLYVKLRQYEMGSDAAADTNE